MKLALPNPGAAALAEVPRSADFVNGEVSFWYRDIGLPSRRAALPGPREYDVCLVGAGYTGLWTAYYLKQAQPDLRIAVLEREFAGFGASGRNGGWLSGRLAGSPERYAASHGRADHAPSRAERTPRDPGQQFRQPSRATRTTVRGPPNVPGSALKLTNKPRTPADSRYAVRVRFSRAPGWRNGRRRELKPPGP